MKTVEIPVPDDSPLADRAWLVQPMAQGEGIHVLPEDEASLHELDRGCWCNPVIEMRAPSTERPHTEPIYLHHTKECRGAEHNV